MELCTKPEWRRNSLQSKVEVRPDLVPAKCKGKDALRAEGRPIQQTSFTDMACPTAQVSAFCRAVIRKVIPKGFWGDNRNERTLMYWVDQFVDLRRFESLTLHQVTQKIQVCLVLSMNTDHADMI